MKITKEFAEILGMFAADGCIQKGYYVCMWGNIYQDKDYYDQVVCPLYSKVFGKNIVAHEKKSNSVYGFYYCKKETIQIFEDLGFTNNKTYDVTIPKEVLETNDKEIYAAFVRGFTDCDGNINFLKRKGIGYSSFQRKYNTYPRVQISSVSDKIMKQISDLLNKLKVHHTLYYRKPGQINEKVATTIAIRGVKNVEDFIKKIGFSNPGHYNKYLIWKKFGMCPINTTLEQRKLILEGKINPFSFYNKAPEIGFEPTTSTSLREVLIP